MLRLFKAPKHTDHDVVRGITERVAAEMTPQLSSLAERMSAAEFRGYIRVRSRELVRQALRTAGCSKPVSTSEREDQEARVLEQVVYTIVRSFTAVPTSSIPVPHVSMHKAA